MTLLVLAIMGVAAGYISLWSAVNFHESLEEKVSSLLMGIAIDVIMLISFMFMLSSSGGQLTLFLIFKYLFLSAINFDKTLRQ